MNRSLKRDLDWFWHGWFFATGTFDQAIESVRVDDGAAEITVRDKADLAMPVLLRLEFTDGSSQWATFPADVWFAGSRTYVARVPLRGRSLKSISLDPENRFQDLATGDNSWAPSIR